MKALNIPKEELKHYRYIGNNLVYDPVSLDKPQQVFDENKSLHKGTGGLLVHPSLRASTSNSTNRSFGKRQLARSFINSEQFNLSGTFVMPTKS